MLRLRQKKFPLRPDQKNTVSSGGAISLVETDLRWCGTDHYFGHRRHAAIHSLI